MQKLMERLDRQDELLLAMKAEGNSRYHGKHPPFRQSGLVYAAPDKQAHPATLPQRRALPYKTLGKKTYYSERTC